MPRRRPLAAAGTLALGLTLLGAVVLTGCASDAKASSPQTIRVLAASSLTGSFSELARAYERRHPGITVSLSFGASSTLARQVVEGAPADVLATASLSTMDAVAKSDLAASAPRVFATNRLEIVVAKGNPSQVRSLADFGTARLRTVICAASVPCGATATAALAAAHVTARPVSYAVDVKAALSTVVSGEADAALVYRTDVIAAGNAVSGVEIPDSAAARTSYPIVVLRSAHPAASGFVDYVESAEGRRVLRDAGFDSP